MQTVVGPLLDNIANAVNQQLIGEFDGSGLQLDFDLSQYEGVSEADARAESFARAALQTGGLTMNEYRAAIGFPQLGERGDFYLMPQSLSLVPAAQLNAPPVLPMVEAPAPTPAPAAPAPTQEPTVLQLADIADEFKIDLNAAVRYYRRFQQVAVA